MKVLHLSSDTLPDRRVERSAQTAKREGYGTCFAGPLIEDTCLPTDLFDKFYELPFNRFANVKIPPYWGALKRKLSEILGECRPDLVHAHNVIAAKLVSEFSVPFVYDDHEYWSKSYIPKAKIWKPKKMFTKWVWTGWEKEALRKASAVIVVCDTVAEEHVRLNDDVYVVPNFPFHFETESLKLSSNKDEHLSSVYVGGDCSNPALLPHRNVENLLQIFSHDGVGTLTVIGDPNLLSSRYIKSVGFLAHTAMMKELTRHHIGLLPWKKHWFHRYCNPNKPYEYAHAGLLVLTVSDLHCVTRCLGEYAVVFNDLYELKELLLYYADNQDKIREFRAKIRKFALRELTWEKKCEPKILQAYSKI